MKNLGNNFLNKTYPDTKLDIKRESVIRNQLESAVIEPERAEERMLSLPDRLQRLEKRNPKVLEKIIDDYIKEAVLDVQDTDKVLKLAKSLYELEKRIAIEQGRGAELEEFEFEGEVVEKYKASILGKSKIQERSLAPWVRYLRSNDAGYPAWFRYYVARALKDMGRLDKNDIKYGVRSESTFAPFPDMNPAAVSFVKKATEIQLEVDDFSVPEDVEAAIVHETVLEKEAEEKIASLPESVREKARKGALKNARALARRTYINQHKEEMLRPFLANLSVDEERRDDLERELTKRLDTKSFSDLYAFAQVETAGNLDRESLVGEWVKYEQGSDCKPLEKSLHGKGTGWCTAEGSASDQLEQGDFFVFYTNNKNGKATEPRIAIRMEEGRIAEVRGVNQGQEVEPELLETAEQFYTNLPGAGKYKKASADMRSMTDIYSKSFLVDKVSKEKVALDPIFDQQELRFLYEVDFLIDGFGYDRDPRIDEVRQSRNQDKDLVAIFCEGDESLSARSVDDLKSDSSLCLGDFIIDGDFDFTKTSSLQYIKGDILVEGTSFKSASRVKDTDKFSDSFVLPGRLVKPFILSGCGDRVADLFQHFDKADATEAAHLLINRRHVDRLVDNLPKFQGFDNNTLADLILSGQVEDFSVERFCGSLYLFRGLNNTTASRIMDSDHDDYQNSVIAVVESLEAFTGLDNATALRIFKVVRRMEKEEYREMFATGLSSFTGLESTLAEELISNNYYTEVANSLPSFKDLSGKIAEDLIMAGCVDEVMGNLSSFKGLDFAGMVGALDKKGQVDMINDNLSFFPGLTHEEMVALIIKNCQEDTFFSLENFKGLSLATAVRLIQFQKGSVVARHLNSFDEMDRSKIIDTLIESDYADAVAKTTSDLSEAQQARVVEKLKEQKDFSTLIDNKELFGEVDQLEAVDALISDGKAYMVAFNLESIDETYHRTVLEKLISTGNADVVPACIENLRGVTVEEVLALLVGHNEFQVISKNLNLLEAFTPEIADKLIDAGFPGIVTNKIVDFKGLSFPIAEKYIKRGLGYVVARNLSHFINLNHEEIAHMLLQTKQVEALARSLSNFEGLSTSIASQLISAGKKSDVQKNYKSFTDLAEDMRG